MVERERRAVLLAEANPKFARQATDCLVGMGLSVCMAMSCEEVFRWLHRRVFEQVIVAAELMTGGETLIARLARLPSITCLIAVGPAGDAEMETRSRTAGATTYLHRPLVAETLAKTLGKLEPETKSTKVDDLRGKT